jgi:MoaA/NifB/PqqE/SkfB family radical SAM enzyme
MKNYAVVMLGERCQMRCQFCATDDAMGTFSWQEAIDRLRALRKDGVHGVVFGGGEPFLWPHGLFRLTRFARELGFHVQIGTNGMHLPADFALEPSVDRWVLPLESVAAAVHNELRPSRFDHHEIILSRLATLAAAGKPVTISTVVTRRNVAGLGALLTWLEDYQARSNNLHAWHLYHLLLVGRGGSQSAHLRIDDSHFEALRSALRTDRFRVFFRGNMFASRNVDFFSGCATPSPRAGRQWRALEPLPRKAAG